MRLYLQQNVFDAALDRIRLIFDLFGDNVAVAYSGGKDSTVIMNMARIVAEERKQLPLKVIFVDQEAEWSLTIDHARETIENTDYDFRWYQVPIDIPNNAGGDNEFCCWGPDVEWMRDKEPGAIHEADLGTREWYALFPALCKHMFGDKPACFLTGIRAEESPRRNLGLTGHHTYKGITWGLIFDKKAEQFNFSPLYDWSISDIWTAIHLNKWNYCRLYDEQWARGVALRDMRLSALHHETALMALTMLQEIDRKTWEAVVKRIPGANTIKHLDKEAFTVPKKLPPMFSDWREYRDHLLKHMVHTEEDRIELRKMFSKTEKRYRLLPDASKTSMYKVMARVCIANDLYGTYLKNWEAGPIIGEWYRWIRGSKDESKLNLSNVHIERSLEIGLRYGCGAPTAKAS